MPQLHSILVAKMVLFGGTTLWQTFLLDSPASELSDICQQVDFLWNKPSCLLFNPTQVYKMGNSDILLWGNLAID